MLRLIAYTAFLVLLGLSGCAAKLEPRAPCACEDALDKLEQQTRSYHASLRAQGILRQRLAACEERGQ